MPYFIRKGSKWGRFCDWFRPLKVYSSFYDALKDLEFVEKGDKVVDVTTGRVVL